MRELILQVTHNPESKRLTLQFLGETIYEAEVGKAWSKHDIATALNRLPINLYHKKETPKDPVWGSTMLLKADEMDAYTNSAHACSREQRLVHMVSAVIRYIHGALCRHNERLYEIERRHHQEDMQKAAMEQIRAQQGGLGRGNG